METGGIGKRLMPLFYLGKWKNSFMYGRMENYKQYGGINMKKAVLAWKV
jgi:hypothetical protein